MKKLFVLAFAFFTIGIAQGQSFLVKKNVFGVGLYTPFEKPGGYALSYERMLDKGRSPGEAQLSFKLTSKLVNDKKHHNYGSFEGVELIDKDAYIYKGFAFTPEIKYYFTWDAPFGPYFSVFGSYQKYTESFVDIADELNNYVVNSASLGRGIGLGFQFKFSELICVDIGGGYIMEDITVKRQGFGELVFTNQDPIKDDGLRVAVSFGLAF